ncbi:hypothetical protein BD289DRAFT_145016 [Coniella lustricola]|uniref:Uncharacterized protein n=1 Tax=Coniella lustricola TaxID=2025994 RepID=A0A2T3AF01_9PEZI|nr:hypothetical protein BD289DRAFT_145016 [Coniella lustricola]
MTLAWRAAVTKEKWWLKSLGWGLAAPSAAGKLAAMARLAFLAFVAWLDREEEGYLSVVMVMVSNNMQVTCAVALATISTRVNRRVVLFLYTGDMQQSH